MNSDRLLRMRSRHRSAPHAGATVRASIGAIARLRRMMMAVTAALLAYAGIAACAAGAPYNPDALAADQISRVTEICQNVMGLSPRDRPVPGLYRGTPHLVGEVSHYQACIASLSDSLRGVNDAELARQAHEACRARGFAPSSPELAECVLQSVASAPNRAAAQAAPAPLSRHAVVAQTGSVGSFFYASAHESLRREQLACARLGFEPPLAAFASCVKGLQDTFFAIDNPVD